jgi:acetyl-CoA carboxylase carboxyl transferase subunit beta
MNWIANFVRPRIKGLMGGAKPPEPPENLWKKCPSCGEMIFHRDLAMAQNVCPQCGFHMRIGPKARFDAIFDAATYEELASPAVPMDPLKFRGEKKYPDELKAERAKTGRQEAMSAARGTLEGMAVMVAVQPFDFIGGSLGMGVGEALVQAMQAAVAEKRPFVLFVSSGGARMQEGILSLMQMPRVTICVDMLREAGLPYIVVLTDPTFGGVSASYAMLGDVQIAEPGAQIGFTGARVIAQTIRAQFPEGFQRAEFLLAHGMLDMVVHRHELRETLSRLVHLLMKRSRPKSQAPAPQIVNATPSRKSLNGSGAAKTSNGSGAKTGAAKPL